MIATKINFLKKKEKRFNKGESHKLRYITTTMAEDLAEQQMITVIPEYQFPHGIFKIASNEMNAEGLKYAFEKLSAFLGLKNNLDQGLTVLVSPQWMFVSTIS